MKQIKVDVSKCTGCGQCALTCSFKNVGKFELDQSNIRIIQWEDICLSVPNLCQQCSDAPCVLACPTEAIYANPETGAIVIDTDLCTLCYLCQDDCPYQVIHINLDGYPLTCDLCSGAPKCVNVCFPGALSFEEIPEDEKEPLRDFAKILADHAQGKKVPPPENLASRSVT